MSSNLHDGDFFAWTQQQSDLLRAGKLSEVDLAHLIYELESMGASERRQLINRLAVLLAHLLKWHQQPTFHGRSWVLTIKEQRRQLERHLKDNPSLAGRFRDFVADAYGDAVLLAARETGLEEHVFPPHCPYSESQILDPEFLPD